MYIHRWLSICHIYEVTSNDYSVFLQRFQAAASFTGQSNPSLFAASSSTASDGSHSHSYESIHAILPHCGPASSSSESTTCPVHDTPPPRPRSSSPPVIHPPHGPIPNTDCLPVRQPQSGGGHICHIPSEPNQGQIISIFCITFIMMSSFLTFHGAILWWLASYDHRITDLCTSVVIHDKEWNRVDFNGVVFLTN
jgi:hypothetical protein